MLQSSLEEYPTTVIAFTGNLTFHNGRGRCVNEEEMEDFYGFHTLDGSGEVQPLPIVSRIIRMRPRTNLLYREHILQKHREKSCSCYFPFAVYIIHKLLCTMEGLCGGTWRVSPERESRYITKLQHVARTISEGLLCLQLFILENLLDASSRCCDPPVNLSRRREVI